jgi:hypothetical protein
MWVLAEAGGREKGWRGFISQGLLDAQGTGVHLGQDERASWPETCEEGAPSAAQGRWRRRQRRGPLGQVAGAGDGRPAPSHFVAAPLTSAAPAARC